MIVFGCVLLLSWSSIDSEQFVGDPEYYFDDQDQQGNFVQGKYIMESLCPIHILII